ncbi:arylsulfatase [Algoriphagus confluentis]|uniref:Sulfatase-like hydrolase/transferase n=1 Tax=Algoriphagus confluentis TaxID=1697556 RepID=A0ABQ6PW53_9BACT|nr:sulfatase-like hydrolase/transferase [Algoriphagus confluentis]
MRFSILLIALLVFSACKEEKAIPPNIVLILTDDQGYGDLGVHGNEVVKTPNLDRLAAESARFDRFYVSPLCAPTRASLLTGRYHLRTGVVSVSKGLETMDAEEYTLAELFRDNGYRTGIFGKWHNGQHYPHHPLAQGFEEFTGFSAGHWSNYFDTHLEKNREEMVFEGYLPDVLTEEALDFIRKNKDQPFFAYLPLNTPHSPHQVPDEYFDPYKISGLSDELAAIYGMVENIDWNVGRIMNLLKELDLDENTLVIFLTDNGPNGQRFNAEMKGVKGSVHEGGVRVPSFWRWKGEIQPQEISTAAAHIDVMPTLTDLFGLEKKEGKPWDGVSLVPLFKGGEIPYRSIFSHVAQLDKELKDRPGAIRKDSLLLTLFPNRSELYDLKNDPKQLVNLAPGKLELVSSLEKEYREWWQEVTEEIEMDRQIPISDLAPEIALPTYEAELKGDLKFFEGHGWAQDWVTNWKNESDSVVWPLNVIDSGEFEVWLEYSAAPNQLGAELNLSTSSTNLTQTLDQGLESIPIPSPDRVPRKEAPEQTWNRILLGQIQLAEGKEKLILSAKKIPSEGLGDIFSIRLLPKNK